MKICWAQYLLWFVIALLGTGSALSACGQKGALYHPDEPAPISHSQEK
jgi:predicted small lipoprotein YifL